MGDKIIFKVTTRTRDSDSNFAHYNVVASDAAEAIKKAGKAFALKAERATEVQMIGRLDVA